MTYGGSGDDSLSDGGARDAERREAAREKAKTLRDEQRKKDRTRRYIFRGGIFVVILLVIGGVVFGVSNGIRPPSPGPLNMQSDGIKIGTGFKAVSTDALKPGEDPVPSKTNSKDVIAIQLYLDYQCPLCGKFEKSNADQIATWVKTGAATLEIHPISVLDRFSLGTKYSTRAANAAGCVANYSPNSYFDFNALLFAKQPAENTSGLSDDQLIALVKQAKTSDVSSISTCVRDQRFKTWVNAASTRATTGPITGTDLPKIEGTPTVVINGEKYAGPIDDAPSFAAAVVKAAGDSFTKDSAKTATPTPSATPKP